ncbi:hypothetical protein P9112_004381 [Eukaryota sp. TZLM1-RC]
MYENDLYNNECSSAVLNQDLHSLLLEKGVCENQSSNSSMFVTIVTRRFGLCVINEAALMTITVAASVNTFFSHVVQSELESQLTNKQRIAVLATRLAQLFVVQRRDLSSWLTQQQFLELCCDSVMFSVHHNRQPFVREAVVYDTLFILSSCPTAVLEAERFARGASPHFFLGQPDALRKHTAVF